MKHSILAITATIALAMPAVASAATVSESFERDLERNHVQTSTAIRAGQDNLQLIVNRAINGSDALFASFERDLNRKAVQAGQTAAIGAYRNVIWWSLEPATAFA